MSGRISVAETVLLGSSLVALLVIGCGRDSTSATSPGDDPGTGRHAPAERAIDLPATDQRLCTGIVLLLDTSGSMSQEVSDRDGSERAKYLIARDALDGIVDYTQEWKAAHADRVLQLAVFHFSSAVHEVLPMDVFDADAARAAIANIPRPAGGTAIGRALEAAFQSLYASGCVRKYVVCITDGQNTSGPRPDRIARQLYRQTGGEVEIHFVAFDTSAARFAFLKDANGTAVEAADGAQLQAQLALIYEKRILAEAAAEQP